MNELLELGSEDKSTGDTPGRAAYGEVRVACFGATCTKPNDKLQLRRKLNEFFTRTGEAKLPCVAEYIVDLLESATCFLVFAHHQVVLDGIEKAVKAKKVKLNMKT